MTSPLLPRTRCSGSTIKWRKPHTLGPSRIGSPNDGLQLWKCLGPCLTMFLCRSPTHRGPVQLPLASDNQGNVYGLLNEYSKKMPTAGLLMEVMFQLTANICILLPKHVKRHFNQWADDLTHPSFSGFDAALRLEVPPLLEDLKIFPWILQHLEREGDLPAAVATEPAAPVPAKKRRRTR